ncbi:MAG: YjbQ family protein [Candidatus Hydrothermota bacterium]|nr:MAG: YjbQ family protein [Candidatus Hydrothermae bacterium]
MAKIFEIEIRTGQRMELIDITSRVREVVRKSGVKNGICVLYVPHTTAAVTVNENADPSVRRDISRTLAKLVPAGAGYEHLEGNADSHIKATMVGPSETLIIEDGDILLGTWQGVFFCEFDGPRRRRILIKILEG